MCIWLDGTCIENYRNLNLVSISQYKYITRLNQVRLPPPHPNTLLRTRVIFNDGRVILTAVVDRIGIELKPF